MAWKPKGDWVCPQCGKIFKKQRQLIQHMRDTHEPATE